MDPVTVGKKIKEIYPEYEDLTDAQLGFKFLSKHGENEVLMNSLLGGEGEIVDKETKAEYEEVNGIINQLLREYNGIPEEERGTSTGLLGKLAPDAAAQQGLISSRAASYMKGVNAVAGTLKDIVGETGVLTDPDIERIASLLPSMGSTTESAEIDKLRLEAVFESKYGKGILGEEEKKTLTKKYPDLVAEVQAEEQNLTDTSLEDAGASTEAVDQAISGQPQHTPIPTPDNVPEATPQGDINTQIQQSMDESSLIPLPVLEELAKVQDVGGNTPLLPILGTLGGGAFGPLGTATGLLLGKHLKRGLKERAEGESFLGSITNNPFDPEDRQEAFEDIKDASIAAALHFVLSPKSILGRKQAELAAKIPGKFNTEPVAQAAVEAAESAPASHLRGALKTAEQAIEKFSGKKLPLSEIINQRTFAGDAARTRAGDIASKSAALPEDAIRSALRDIVREEGGFAITAIDDILSGLHTAGRFGKRWINPLTVSQGVVAGSLLKALSGK